MVDLLRILGLRCYLEQNEVELGKQWANNKLLTSLSDDYKAFGCLRRGKNITVLFKTKE